jgi:glycosyltransferase involved in cell wall biosynthesis
VIVNEWLGYGPQKRFAEDAAKHDWILNLDADEWLPDEARAEMTSVLSKPIPEQIHGFRLNIKTVYPGAAAPRIFADAHHYVRLYNRTKCRFPTALVHDEIKLPRANRGRISAPVYHHSIRSLAHLIEKNKAYYHLQTKEIRKSRLGVSMRIVFEPGIVFLKYYFLKRHFTGGVYGLMVASTVAYLKSYRLAVIAFGPKSAERKNS